MFADDSPMYSFEEGSSASRGDEAEAPPTFALTSTAIKRKKQEGGSSGSRSEQEFDTNSLVGFPDEMPKKRPVGRPRGSGRKKTYSQIHQDIQQQQQQQQQDKSAPIAIPPQEQPDYIAPLVNKKMEDLERRRNEKVENDKKKYNLPKDAAAAPKVAWEEGVTGGDDEEDNERSRLYKDVEDNHRLWPHLKEGCKKKLTPRSSVRDLEDELQRCQNVKKTDKALMALKAFDVFSANITEYLLVYGLKMHDFEGLGELAEATQGACEDTLKELAVKYRDRLSLSPELAYLFFSAMRASAVAKANRERRQERAPPAADYAKANLQGYEDL